MIEARDGAECPAPSLSTSIQGARASSSGAIGASWSPPLFRCGLEVVRTVHSLARDAHLSDSHLSDSHLSDVHLSDA